MKKLLTLVVAVAFTTTALAQIPVTGSGDGLKGSYWYGSQDFGNPIPDGSNGGENYAASSDFAGNAYLTQPGTHEFDRVDSVINFDWGNGNPFNDHLDGGDCGEGQHCFSILWEGYILSPISGDVNIDLTYCDDAFSLEIWDVDDLDASIAKYDDEYLTGWNWDKDFWVIPVTFEKDHFYKIVLKYYDGSWSAHIKLRWYSEEYSIESEIIPQAQLYSELPTSDGIKEVTTDDNGNDAVYNLSGIKMNGPLKPGLYIKNGKKFLQK